jgi:hypothetical protein
MPDTNLARSILETLGRAFPQKLDLHDLKAASPDFAGLPDRDWLSTLQALRLEGKLGGEFLDDGQSIADAAALYITERGRLQFTPSTSAPRLADVLKASELPPVEDLAGLVLEELVKSGKDENAGNFASKFTGKPAMEPRTPATSAIFSAFSWLQSHDMIAAAHQTGWYFVTRKGTDIGTAANLKAYLATLQGSSDSGDGGQEHADPNTNRTETGKAGHLGEAPSNGQDKKDGTPVEPQSPKLSNGISSGKPAPPVFFSYSFKDTEWKNRIVAVLKARGIDTWEDSRVKASDIWDSEVHRAIDGARVAVLLITPDFLSSSNTIREEQIRHLIEGKKRLYPVLISACEWQKFDWLSRIAIFPSDLLPLAETDDTRLHARLALAALEISSFAGIATAPQMVSAKLTQSDGRFAGMAALVRPDVALSVIAGSDQGAPYSLEFPNLQPSTVQAVVDLFDQSLNLRLLRLNSPMPWQVEVSLSVPDPGAVWECITFPSASSAGEFTTGTVSGIATRNGRQYLHLQPSIEQHEARGMSGAAIVVAGRVVAVLESQGAILDEWFAIPLQAVGESPIGAMIQRGASTPPKPPQPDEPESEFDGTAFLERLTDSARGSLERAEAYRRALGQSRLHMEHLLLGLYGQPDSPMRRLAREANVFDEQAFRKLLSTANPKLVPDLKLEIGVSVTSLAPLSKHVRQALLAAQKSGRPAIGRHSLMDGAFSVDCAVVSALRNALPISSGPAVPSGPVRQQDWLPDVSTDMPGEKDQDLLNIQRDVSALCSVIAAADAALPLSIGLFGDWGSGKSFFMKEMEKKLNQLAAQGAPLYCSSIVQLKFNAWHYMDTTLWASLTSEIFEGLATALSKSPGAKPENKAAELLADMSSSRDRLADAERKKGDAEAELAKSEQRLQELQSSAAEVSANLSPRVLLTEATRFALDQEEVKKEINKAAKELNLPQVAAAGAEVNRELMELRGIGSAMLLAMRNTERLWLWVAALGLVVAAVFGLPPLVRLYLPITISKSVGDLIAAITTALGTLVAFLGPFLVPARRALKYLQDARKKSDEIVQQKQAENKTKLVEERNKKQSELNEQNQNVEKARAALKNIEQAIEGLRADRQMLDFIRQRNMSTDYTSHLGVIARAHKDFRELSVFLERVGKEPPQPNLPRVERIVLYIDDLDRCPEGKVMDVLQAVYLLLAFPLFVVVVGVDPRWLLHSVAERSPALRRDGPAQELWQTTPLNYLEKIFQIPFTLSPMTDVGFGQLVEKVASIKDGAQPEQLKTAAVPAATLVAPVVPAPAESQPVSPAQPRLTAGPAHGRDEQETATPAPGNTRPVAEPLKIEAWEREFMKQLYCLIPSPRAGKRFVNIYRMIRSTVDSAKWEAFVGDKMQGGHHRQTLLLLAILTGYPAEAAQILRKLIEREHNETWWEFVDSLSPPGENWPELRFKLQSLRALIPETEGCDVFREYAPWVARYSFQSGRVLLAQRLPETDN